MRLERGERPKSMAMTAELALLKFQDKATACCCKI